MSPSRSPLLPRAVTKKSYRVCERCWIALSKAWEEKLQRYVNEGRNDIEPPPKCHELRETYQIRTCDFCHGETIWSHVTPVEPTEEKQ
jgi:hypothetical protein